MVSHGFDKYSTSYEIFMYYEEYKLVYNVNLVSGVKLNKIPNKYRIITLRICVIGGSHGVFVLWSHGFRMSFLTRNLYEVHAECIQFTFLLLVKFLKILILMRFLSKYCKNMRKCMFIMFLTTTYVIDVLGTACRCKMLGRRSQKSIDAMSIDKESDKSLRFVSQDELDLGFRNNFNNFNAK
jgi:hypothetical protein